MAKKAVLAGGGSGGHVFPALAVGKELERRGWTVSFIGGAAGLEARLARAEALDFHALPVAAMRGRSWARRLAGLAVLARSTGRAVALLRRLRSEVVVATGGYASVPAGLAAFLCRLPLLLVEPNATSGLANRFLSRFAREAAVAWPLAGSRLRCPSTLTGVPVRAAFFDVPEAALPVAGVWRLLVLGGSQGAQTLNRLLPAAVERLRDRGLAVEVLHQAGAGKVEEPTRAYGRSGATAEVVPFLDDVPGAMARSHLVLSRCGAITLAEICAAGRPAVLFPLSLAGGHQLENARILERAGAAVVLADEAEAGELADLLTVVLESQRLAEMAAAAHRLATPEAAARIADRAEALAQGR